MRFHTFCSILISVCIVLTMLTGCGADQEDPSAEGSSFESPVPTEEPAPTPTPTPFGNGLVIVLDPGHSSVVSGGTEPIGPGAAQQKQKDTTGTHGDASGMMEYQLTLAVCLKLREALWAEGYTVYLTREDHTTAISNVERAQKASDLGADIFLRIHADGNTDRRRDGAQTICITGTNPYHPNLYPESRSLSDNILTAYCQETGLRNLGVWETDSMTGNNWAAMPATLLELGFMTNAEEDLRLSGEEFQNVMVAGIVKGIDNYFAGRALNGDAGSYSEWKNSQFR